MIHGLEPPALRRGSGLGRREPVGGHEWAREPGASVPRYRRCARRVHDREWFTGLCVRSPWVWVYSRICRIGVEFVVRARARTRGKQGAGGIVVINATRDGLKREARAKKLGIPKPLRAIRLKCLDCVCHQEKLIRECLSTGCALWPYRMGKYPKDVASGTVETLQQTG